MSFITIATFPNTMLAHIAKGKLASCGIESLLLHEHFHSTASFALGEIPLQVKENEVEAAQRILAEDFSED